jgi:hypothetical protein
MSCPDCTTGVKLAGTPKGVINEDGSYLAAAPEASDHKRTVILLTDAFGLGIDNPKIMADYFSEQLQCDVWVPNFFNGKSLSQSSLCDTKTKQLYYLGKPLVRENQLKMPERAGEKIGALAWLKFSLAIISSLPKFIANRPSVADKRIKTVCHSSAQMIQVLNSYDLSSL